MILYHPFDDVYHCFYRISLIISRLPIKEYDIKHIQIFDFYFLFPGLLRDITWPQELGLYRKYIRSFRKPYAFITDDKSMIKHLEHQATDVLRYMAAYNLIDVDKIRENIVLLNNKKRINEIVGKTSNYDNDLLDFLVNVLAKIPLNGKNGLKRRTGLFEYRYDND
jgi:hypothetical protein